MFPCLVRNMYHIEEDKEDREDENDDEDGDYVLSKVRLEIDKTTNGHNTHIMYLFHIIFDFTE